MAINWNQVTQDFTQKYNRTYVHVKLPNRASKTLFYIRGVQASSEGPPELTLTNPTDGTVILKYNTDSEIYFDYPEVGYFFHKNMALLNFRRMERNWTRGFCNFTSYIRNPYEKYLQCPVEFNHDLAAAVYASLQKYTLAEAVEVLNKRTTISVPLTKEFALGQDVRETSGVYLLWYLDQPVAEYTGSAIVVKAEQFRQEIRDFCSRSNQKEVSIA